MGIKSSRSDNRKPFWSLGRSSQRHLLTKTSSELNRIQKKIDQVQADQRRIDELWEELTCVSRDLDGYAAILKHKHRDEFEQIKEKLSSASSILQPRIQKPRRKSVELKIVKITTPNASVQGSPTVQQNARKTKFGVAVLPTGSTHIRTPTLDEDAAFQQLNGIGEDVDRIESQLRYFHGKKDDEKYSLLRYGLVQHLLKTETIESHENPVLNQEKRIIAERIQELVAILEKLAEQDEENENVDS